MNSIHKKSPRRYRRDLFEFAESCGAPPPLSPKQVADRAKYLWEMLDACKKLAERGERARRVGWVSTATAQLERGEEELECIWEDYPELYPEG